MVPLLPVFLSYVLSFIYVGIYWNNHHHMLHAVQHINGRALWANLHLLFWLSLVPFVTGWVNENHFAAVPVAFYGVVLLMAGVSYYLLERVLIAHHGKDSPLARAMGKDYKGILSVCIYAVAIGLAFVNPWVSLRVVCPGRDHVVHPRPADRTHAPAGVVATRSGTNVGLATKKAGLAARLLGTSSIRTCYTPFLARSSLKYLSRCAACMRCCSCGFTSSNGGTLASRISSTAITW